MISFRKPPSFPTTFFRQVGRRLPFWGTLLLVLVAAINAAASVLGVIPAWAGWLLDAVSNFSAVFLGIFIEAAPFLLLGTIASGIVEVFISREDLARWIPRQPLPGALAGSLMGLFFPVCECGVVPFTRRLLRKGVTVPVAVSVLLAAPVLNPIVIASTLAAFGPGPIFWGRIGLTLVIAVSTGWIFSRHGAPQSLLREDSGAFPLEPDFSVKTDAAQKPTFVERVRQAMLESVDEFFEMGRFLIIGALLAALMQTFLSQPALLSVGQGPVHSVLVMTLMAVILSICSTVDAFIALAFTGSFTGGAVLAFLVFGPMVDIKSTLMFLRVFKPRVVLLLVGLPFLMTVTSTVIVNLLWKGAW